MVGYFVRHPVAANIMMVIMILLGLASISGIERETFPDVSSDSVRVTVTYPGASARDVDEDVCTPLEDAVSGITGLDEFTCLSVDSRATATADLETGGELLQFFNDISSAVSGVRDFPDAVEEPSVEVVSQTALLAFVAVSGIEGREGLAYYSEGLADKLQAIPGVATADVRGIAAREISVQFDQDALQRYGLSSGDVAGAISARSLRQPLGSADLGGTSMTLRYSGASRTVAELQDLTILETATGGVVRLRDLGTVTLVDQDDNAQSFIDGVQTAIVQVVKTEDGDSIRVFEAVDAVLEAERGLYPAPFALTVINNTSEVVEERINLILGNIATGLVLVFIVMWMFFSLNEALWISAALPVSFLGGLFLMSLFGITINMVTLVALLMAVGLIMDDSIVIAENISTWRTRVGPIEAATKGTLEVLPGVASSFLTTACVFGPLMFLTGDMGQILRFVPMVLLLTLAISLVEGFLILPNHLSHTRMSSPEAQQRRVSARALKWVLEVVVMPASTLFSRWRYVTLGSTFAILVLTIGIVASGTIKVIGFPSTEADTVVARIALTSGIDRQRTVDTVDQILAGLEAVDAERTPLTEGGDPLVTRVLVQYATNADTSDNGAHTATITVDLLESSRRNITVDEMLADWKAAAGPLPDVVQASFASTEVGPGGLDLDVEVVGSDLEEVESAAGLLLARLLARPDVTEAYQDFYAGRQEVQVRLNAFGSSAGLTPQSLSAQLRDAFEGSETDSFRAGPTTVTVRVELADSVQSLTELEQFPIAIPNGGQTALTAVADLVVSNSYPTITRKNGQVVAGIQGRIDRSATTSAAISAVVTGELGPEIMAQYPGVDIAIGGATQDQQESQMSMVTNLSLGLIGVYMVLAFQFRSYVLPLAVMLSIPFALIGTILGHWALGHDLSMPSFVGFASLAGIVVNNAILFLTFFQTHLKGGDYVAASLNAVRDRFRPILLSTSTTFVGLLPILFDSSPQVQTLVPLVVAVAFGLLASMVLVVLIFPAVLSIYFDIFDVRKWIGQFDEDDSAEPATA